ncbi:putative UDP-glucose flavonoid 3-O-glucosyltransferase 3 [Sesamum alatum]|uniref:UDP-glucose flavonoid 3-O-glucosyltransferase 3 n=1 Tax=Sesamum alatum TaxID=300844 RepID=A0AAE1YWQ2_9LAMI|nr:putative UDP-glucose flavonoid 3-O-glucosyltransferase 3 [Sesamum alatum]
MDDQKAELVFIPSPGLSHLVSTVETAKLLLERDDRLSITVLIMKLPNDSAVDKYTQNISSNSRLRFINVPTQEETSPSKTFIFGFINNQIAQIREIIADLIKQPSLPTSQLAGLVLDMFCTKFIEIADEFNLPSYCFFTSSACTLGLFYHLVSLKFEQNQDLTEYRSSNAELPIACFSNPVPAKVLPAVFVEEGPLSAISLSHFKRLTETKGIMVNTFYELESYAIQSLLSDCKKPKVYPVGPILNSSGDQSFDEDIKKWLDDQPGNSVVFLCFGTRGSFEEAQVREIALALENSGKRFLWSLRKPVLKGTMPFLAEYENFKHYQKGAGDGGGDQDRLQEGLQGREAAGNCGAEEIETAIRRLMAEEGGSGVRQKVKEMKNKSRMALMEGGSSYNAQKLFIEDVIGNIAK